MLPATDTHAYTGEPSQARHGALVVPDAGIAFVTTGQGPRQDVAPDGLAMFDRAVNHRGAAHRGDHWGLH